MPPNAKDARMFSLACVTVGVTIGSGRDLAGSHCDGLFLHPGRHCVQRQIVRKLEQAYSGATVTSVPIVYSKGIQLGPTTKS